MVMGSSPTLLIILLTPVVLAAAVGGLILGWITATVLRRDRSAVPWDALLAPLAFLIVGSLALAMPCHGCEYVERSWIIRNQVPYPALLALGAACLAPVLHQIFRRGPGSNRSRDVGT